MKMRVEFISHVRELTGTKEIELDADAESPVLAVIGAVEKYFSKKNLRLLEHNALIKGLLIFKRKPKAGTVRVIDLQERLKDDETLVIGTGMEGG